MTGQDMGRKQARKGTYQLERAEVGTSQDRKKVSQQGALVKVQDLDGATCTDWYWSK